VYGSLEQSTDREGVTGREIEIREPRGDIRRLDPIEVTTETPNAEVVDKVAQIKELTLKINDTDPIYSTYIVATNGTILQYRIE
jgi:hypothetical protein